jgi:hypothetical protein
MLPESRIDFESVSFSVVDSLSYPTRFTHPFSEEVMKWAYLKLHYRYLPEAATGELKDRSFLVRVKAKGIQRFMACVSLVLVLAGCGLGPVKLDPQFFPDPAFKPYPLSIGYYFSFETINYVNVLTAKDAERIGLVTGGAYTFSLGTASVEVFSKTFLAMFQCAERIQEIPPATDGEVPFDALIEIKIEAMNRPLGYLAEIIYRCALYSPLGDEILTWRVYGRANTGETGFMTPGKVESLAIENAVYGFVMHFRDFPGVQSWLASKDITYPEPPITRRDEPSISEEQLLKMPIVVDHESILIGADPYVEVDRLKKIIGPDFIPGQLLPLRIVVINKGDDPIWVQRGGAPLQSALIRETGPPRMWLMSAPLGSAPGGVGAVGRVLTSIEALAKAPSFFREYEQWRQRVEGAFESHLTDALLRRGEAVEGFLYFRLAPDATYSDTFVEMHMARASNGSASTVRLPLDFLDQMAKGGSAEPNHAGDGSDVEIGSDTDRPILHFDVEEKDGRTHVVMAATTADGRRVGTDTTHGAVWSPKGTWFAVFASTDGASGPALYAVNLKREVELIYDPKGTERIIGWHPAWSPDGRKIAVLAAIPSNMGRRDFSVTVIDAVGKKVLSRHRIPEGTINLPYHLSPPNNFRWAPDGRKILVSWEKVVVIDVEKGRVFAVSDEPAVAEWAPDSESVLYFAISDRANPRERALGGFYAKKLDDSNPVELMDRKGLATLGLSMHPGIHFALMVLSPTGSGLAIVTGTTKGEVVQLQLHDLKGGSLVLNKPARTFQTDELITALEWAPDESRVAAVTLSKGGRVAIKVLDLKTGKWNMVAEVNLDLKQLGVAGLELFGFKNLSWTQ